MPVFGRNFDSMMGCMLSVLGRFTYFSSAEAPVLIHQPMSFISSLSNCSFSLQYEETLTKFNLLNVLHKNTTQSLIDYDTGDNFVFPNFIENFFIFIDWKDASCGQSEKIHPNYNEYNFKIEINEKLLKRLRVSTV